MLMNQNKIFDKKFDKIVWAHGIEQPEYFAKLKQDIQNIEFIEGFPEKALLDNKLFQKHEHGCLVIG